MVAPNLPIPRWLLLGWRTDDEPLGSIEWLVLRESDCASRFAGRNVDLERYCAHSAEALIFAAAAPGA